MFLLGVLLAILNLIKNRIMDIIFIIIITVLVIGVLLSLIVLSNNYLFNAIFNRKERKFWKFFIRNVNKFDYIGYSILGKSFRWDDYVAIIWFDDTCSIHIDSPTKKECIGTNFDKVMSNKMRDLLLSKIN
jgi:hypothetical protein